MDPFLRYILLGAGIVFAWPEHHTSTYLPSHLPTLASAARAAEPNGKTFGDAKDASKNQMKARTNSVGMKFRLIPAGEFMMGATGFEKDEQPVHKVRITKAFYLGETEVTQGQWKAVMENDPSCVIGSTDLPVEMVSWNDAVEFCRKLFDLEKVCEYRLPTEAEWEYACRARTAGEYYGDPDRIAWYAENSQTTTHPVAQKQPNAWGLYDMSGNVWEWCQDWYGSDYYRESPQADPKGPKNGEWRVIRGGAESASARYCRSATRAKWRPDDSGGIVNGFRVVMTPRKKS